MRKRNCQIVVRFTKDELDSFTKKVRKSGLSREGFLRKLVNGVQIKEAPTMDVAAMTNELRRIGYNLNQTLTRMNTTGVLDMPRFREDLNDIRKATKLITDAYSSSEG